MTGLLLRDVDVEGRRVDVRTRNGTIAGMGRGLRPEGDAEVVEGSGGALLPGLHDHHIHLLATAAAWASVLVGPGDAPDARGLARILQGAGAGLAPGAWLRAVGYHESVAGDLDRTLLDGIIPDRPVRVQHRTGMLWVLNSAAIEALDLEGASHPGAERDSRGRLTGRFHRADAWLGALVPGGPPDLATVGAALARHGITGVTDATPFGNRDGPDTLAAAVAGGDLPQRVVAMGGAALAGAAFPEGLERGPVKLVIDDGYDPDLDALARDIALAHRHGRPVAIHCVTRVALVLALAAWEEAGSWRGDRVEHGSVVPPDLYGQMVRLGLAVVTQPSFVAERGDEYLTGVDPDDLPHLYPCRSLLAAGMAVAASSDAPYTGIDPWASMRAAVTRTTRGGARLGPEEAVDPATAMDLYLGDPHRPGGPPRRVRPGAPADLCLLDGPVPQDPADLRADRVVATVISGTRVF